MKRNYALGRISARERERIVALLATKPIAEVCAATGRSYYTLARLAELSA